MNIAPKPVERLVRKIGQERIDQRDAAVAVHEQLPLMAKDVVANPTRSSPSVAMVSVDGGRLQIRSDHSEPKQDSHWRESKVSVLETYHSDVHEADPDPDVPRCFFDLKRTKEMVRGLGHPLPVGLEFQDECQTRKQEEATEKGHSRKPRPGRPKRLVRSVLASRKCAEEFGPMVHQAAWERNFFGAKRRAFLGDGLPVNWTIQRRHFASFTPILDFVHALSYVFSAAFAGRPLAEGTEIYKRWIQAVWSGQVATILTELEERSAALGSPPSECADSDPRKLVFESFRYLKNNADKMRYDDYRLGDEIARQLIEINVQEQADDWPEEELGECPVCGGAARKAPDEPRVLTTTRGDVTWKQRVGNCPRCRRAFFPSESSVRH